MPCHAMSCHHAHVANRRRPVEVPSRKNWPPEMRFSQRSAERLPAPYMAGTRNRGSNTCPQYDIHGTACGGHQFDPGAVINSTACGGHHFDPGAGTIALDVAPIAAAAAFKLLALRSARRLLVEAAGTVRGHARLSAGPHIHPPYAHLNHLPTRACAHHLTSHTYPPGT